MKLKKIYIIPLILIGFYFPSNCTDSDACNFNPDALNDDGSCYYPLNDCNEDFQDCCPPSGFGHNPQTNQLSLGVDYAFKFNSQNTLDIYDDWIGGFKVIDETQNGLCVSISEDCPDINLDGYLTENAEFCVGSYYWNGDSGNSRIPLYGFDGDPYGYLNPGDQPYFKLFDSDTDTLYFMQAYKNGEEFQITYEGNAPIEFFEIDSLVAECPFYNNFDSDNDGIPDTCDQCPNDANNDSDNDGICGNVDICPEDFYNDIDGDGICGDIDECPNDFENDIDGDGICSDIDECPFDGENDIDGDGICGDIDECPNDFENDIDGDGICSDIDECPFDGENDIDGDGICGDIDECPNDFYNDIDDDDLCGDIDPCPFDINNDFDNDGICDDVDPCVGEYDECGECNGDGIIDNECDCEGNILDQCGVCGGFGVDQDNDGICDDVDPCVGEYDECGECNGDGSSCLNNNIEFPSKFYLSFSYPNPFNPETTFNYGLPENSNVKIIIYDSMGKIIDIPINYFHSAGNYSYTWNANNYSSGIYYFQLISNNFMITRKATFLK